MNALPLVSVVVPNYNYKRYLNLRIQSILQQTYQNIELILRKHSASCVFLSKL